jgi:hypothetical protein
VPPQRRGATRRLPRKSGARLRDRRRRDLRPQPRGLLPRRRPVRPPRRRPAQQLPPLAILTGGAVPLAGGAAGPGAASEEAKAKEKKMVFDVKLKGFDAAAKLKIIKELRTFTNLGRVSARSSLAAAATNGGIVVWTSLGPLPRWVPGPTTWWAPGTTRLALHGN